MHLRDRMSDANVGKVVIIGGGAAGLACANELRALGYAGEITMLSADADPPCDRPNLSKDYLAGTAAEEWIPLRSDDWYREQAITLRLRRKSGRSTPNSGPRFPPVRRTRRVRPAADRDRLRAPAAARTWAGRRRRIHPAIASRRAGA